MGVFNRGGWEVRHLADTDATSLAGVEVCPAMLSSRRIERIVNDGI